MRKFVIVGIVLLISSCGLKKEKQLQIENSIREEYMQKGKEVVTVTQAELLKNVAGAIQEGGPGYAIDFCNLRAFPIKDSLSEIYDCKIQRIAVKYRNEADKPQTENEIKQLALYENSHEQGDTLEPVIYLLDDRVEYYHPILINNGACLLCHGSTELHIAEETMEKIKERYPNDLATGFAFNDFRGSWKITFQK